MTNRSESPAQQAIDELAATVTKAYRERIDPLSKRLLFSVPHPASDVQRHPFVLVLGNHSSGKSTFVNFLLGREVQKTGVAPTDDGFTIIAGAETDSDLDGDTVVTTPRFGLGEIASFHPDLRRHLRVKFRSGCPIVDRLWLVDSPGMIDSADSSNERRYDFLGAVAWLAERADLILLLFDPDKPGTTGETLKALTSSLVDMDHKLLIIFNKADQFQAIHDFARAYGALCWNLAKVIPRKDLPRIYNCYVPGAAQRGGQATIPLEDFDQARAEIVEEIRKVPERRVNNMVTCLHSQARELLAHATVCRALSLEYCRVRRAWRAKGALTVAAGLAVAAAVVKGLLSWQTLGVALLFALVGRVLYGHGRDAARAHVARSIDDPTPVFEREHHQYLKIADRGDLVDLWERVLPRTRRAFATASGDCEIPCVTASELAGLQTLVERDVPGIRAALQEAKLRPQLPAS